MFGADTTFLVELEIREHPSHPSAVALLKHKILDKGVSLALAPQVLAEFIHIVTDPRRFEKPLSRNEAITKALFWWNADEVHHVFPNEESTRLALKWMQQYQLGRKRILDTQLAATLWIGGVRRILTSNPGDFRIFSFEIFSP